MEILPEVIILKIIKYMKNQDIIIFEKSNKFINNLIVKNNNLIYFNLLKNLNYSIYENIHSFNIHKKNYTFSITKSINIKTLADVLKLSKLNDI